MSIVTEQNKDDLKIYMFPNVKINFAQLFDCVD